MSVNPTEKRLAHLHVRIGTTSEASATKRIAHALMDVLIVQHGADGQFGPLTVAETSRCHQLAGRAVRTLDPDDRIAVAQQTVAELLRQFDGREVSREDLIRASLAAYEARLSAEVRS